MLLCMCLHVHRGPCPQDFFWKIHPWDCSVSETHPRNHPSLITCNSTYIMCAFIHACVCVSVCACMLMCMCLHVSVQNIMCSAGPEVTVLDWYGPEADPVYWRRGRGGGGGRTPGSVWSTHSRGENIGASPRKNWEFRPSYTDYIPGTSDFLCRLPLPGHSDISLPHFICLCNSSCALVKVHYCKQFPNFPQNNSYIHARVLKIQETSKLKMFLTISRD